MRYVDAYASRRTHDGKLFVYPGRHQIDRPAPCCARRGRDDTLGKYLDPLTSSIGPAQAGRMAARLAGGDTIKSKRDRAILSTLHPCPALNGAMERYITVERDARSRPRNRISRSSSTSPISIS
jgi:hypothetical protein